MKRALPLALALILAACAGDNGPAETADAGAEATDHEHAPGTPADHDEPAVTLPPTPGSEVHDVEGDHTHTAPHGGAVKTAGSGHLEFVPGDGTFAVYPLDAAEAALPVADIAGAQAVIQPRSGSAQTLSLEPMGDHLMGTLPGGVGAYTAIVTVPVAGESRSARFEVGLDGDFEHAH